jgi:SAM-dependent methyltransferase
MSEDAGYIHGTASEEQARLAALNRLTNTAFVDFLAVRPGMRVLEVGSGLGLLAVAVADAAPGVEVVGVERSEAQLAAARADPRVRFVRGDAHRLDFPDGTFDLAYARYLLEHVSGPAAVVSEMRRVTRPGGRVAALENDISLVRVDPPCPAFDMVWEAFQRLQRQLGGDAHVGRRLYRLFRDAGLTQIELSVQPEIHWHGSPGFTAWIRNLIGNVESARRGLIQAGLCDTGRIDGAVAELAALLENDRASAPFVWNRAVGVR